MAPAPSSAAQGAGAPCAARTKRDKADLIAEHLGFSAERFATQGMDLANRTMYTATAKVEQSLQKLVDDGVEGFDEDEVQRGIYRLETLLEDAIDTRFDLFEIFVLRNTFTFADDLLPYIVLPHHEHLDPSLQGADEPTLAEYEEELRLYEDELQKEHELACAELFVKARHAKAVEQAELVGYLKPPGKLDAATSSPSDRARILSSQLTLLQTHLASLLSTPTPPRTSSSAAGPAAPGGAADTDVAPWAASRSAFVNWAAGVKAGGPSSAAAAAGGEGAAGKAASGQQQQEDAIVAQLRQQADETGSAGDAKALLGLTKAAK
ncbi:hypothetical protein Rhopal_004255-T1 [Rhodotorula paludigena]|uniref:Uncharacterized protein n=1 Tax=Rhodotorula paludigena TaxID=86838 RepID=A0AAV5GQE0_9BASI|nr:hypothetical protein Rhopal_004255-T1 [Rhodotorula paludigena]